MTINTTNYTPIGGIEFREAILEGLLVDPWLAHVELVAGEAAWPHSWEKPKLFRISFDEVIEFRGCRAPIAPEQEDVWKGDASYQAEGVIRAGEVDAASAGEVERLDDGRFYRLKNVVFRDLWRRPPEHEKALPLIAASKPPRLVWLSTWGSYIEFLYCGQVSHEILTSSEAVKEWRLQHARFGRAAESRRKISAGISKWRRAAERQPRSVDALARLGQLYLGAGDNAKARACYEKAFALAPSDLQVLDLEAALARTWDERVAAYRRTLQHYPDLRDARSSLGWFEALAKEQQNLPPPAWPSGRDPGPD